MDAWDFKFGIQHVSQMINAPAWTTNRSWLWQLANAAYRRRLPIANPERRAQVRQFLNGIRTGKVAL